MVGRAVGQGRLPECDVERTEDGERGHVLVLVDGPVVRGERA